MRSERRAFQDLSSKARGGFYSLLTVVEYIICLSTRDHSAINFTMASYDIAQMKQYLILPARLPDIFTLEQFRAMFPRATHSSPQIKTLYRDLQAQRAAMVDAVSAEINSQARDNRHVRRRLKHQNQEAMLDEADVDLEAERAMYGGAAAGLRAKRYSLDKLVPALDSAANALEAEIARLETEEEALLEQVQATVSSLSDLRYGKPENPKLGEEVLESLEAFRATCIQKTG
jgi:centromere-localized protein 2